MYFSDLCGGPVRKSGRQSLLMRVKNISMIVLRESGHRDDQGLTSALLVHPAQSGAGCFAVLRFILKHYSLPLCFLLLCGSGLIPRILLWNKKQLCKTYLEAMG